ncbi:MAG: hypothetical protein CSA60_04195 [Neptuniibacter caesariensis]|uniref:Uncharacterized protein n=1 Tax=Neptuniibacter caesariensis TaxID=207954 RepID=A0A2G6JJL3_NEPCE|nr:MAG: hypothetical protein CSA60_04195 [Neptuniibacter caesariensis]
MVQTLSPANRLKNTQRQCRDQFPEALGLRVHRAISWLLQAEKQQDKDGRFLFLWIAFNSAYANELGDTHISEKRIFRHFISRICELDSGQELYSLVWDKYTSAIRVLLENKYVYQPYWDWANQVDKAAIDWQTKFQQAKQYSHKALGKKDTAGVLHIVFDRLYTLRNQLVHGGATHNSQVNRDQLRDACDILSDVMPIIVQLMMEHPNALWGDAIYPVMDK